MAKNLLSIKDLSKDEILDLIKFSNNFIDDHANFRKEDLFPDKTVASIFCEPSTRTKSSFAIAAGNLGCSVIDFDVDGNLVNQDANYPPVVYRTFNKYNYSSLTYKIDMRFNLRDKNTLAFYFGQSDHLDVSLASFTKIVEQNGSVSLEESDASDILL